MSVKFWGWFPKADEKQNLQQQLNTFLTKKSPYIQQGEFRDKMIKALEDTATELDNNKLYKAKHHLSEVQHYFESARCKNEMLSVYRKVHAFLISLFYVLLFGLAAGLIILYEPLKNDTSPTWSILYQALVAFAGGGIGGTTAVLSKAIGLRVQTEAITAQVTWFWVKPILGAIMGLVTFLAIVSGFSLVSGMAQVDKPYGFFLVGFLGGYLESFSTNLLNRLADSIQKEEHQDGKGKWADEIELLRFLISSSRS